MTLRPSCGDPSLFKLLFQHLAADPAAESRHRQCAGDDDHEEPGGCGGVHGVDVGLFRAIVQHGAGPAVRVKKEYHISIDASQGNQHIGQQIDGLVAVGFFVGHTERRLFVADKQFLENTDRNNAEKRSYSVSEAAEILGVSKRSIYNLCASGAFKSVRIGTKLRISRKSFDEWLDGSD